MVWWSDPAKEVLNILFNRVLAPYVENLDMNQLNYGIGQGQVTLTKLRLKKGALDKFRLPVDVIDGHLGKLSLSLHWMNLGNQPVEVLIEDVYLLVVPSSQSSYDPEEEERRVQAAKFERLENAELLNVRAQSVSQDNPQSQGLIASLVTKILNNLQVTVRNIHIRYEDKLSVPGHPFAVGVTLASFTAVSVNEQWQPAFIDSKAGAVHKLARLESLAVYFDTDCQSLAGLSYREFVEKFTALISKGRRIAPHQFILKPVSGEGKIRMNHKLDKETPRFDVQLSFDEIGVLLDEHQYRDAISLIDMYHFYIRQHQYQKYRPVVEEMQENRSKALLRFATTAILDEVRERKQKWTWAYFAERRDDRHRYVDLFKRKQLGSLIPADVGILEALERKLSYEDLRFYRSIARSQLRKDMATRRKLDQERKQQQPQKQTSWSSWLWSSSSASQSSPNPDEAAFTGEMTDEQRRQLYEALDYDEKAALAESLDTPRDALKVRVKAQLNRGSFALKADPHGKDTEIISVVFDIFQATFLQRQDNFETSLSLGGFAVRDGTTANTAYPLIVHVQEKRSQSEIIHTLPEHDKDALPGLPDPFFFLKFERNPLDGRADSALTVRMRYMEIVYHRGYVEAVYRFLKPPASQLDSVEALLDAATQTLESLRKETRIGLEYALQTHKTVDVQMDLNAPIIIVPEDVTSTKGKHLVVDAGHISIVSELASKEAIQEIHSKRNKQYTEADYKRLESMMYDRLTVRLQAAQFLIGDNLESCLKALRSNERDNMHLLERTNIDLQVQNSIVPTAYSLARFKISGHLPTLQVNMSDTKYKALMRLIDVAIPHFDDETDTRAYSAQIPSTSQRHASGAFKTPSGFFGAAADEYAIETDDEDDQSQSQTAQAPAEHPELGEGDDEFFEADMGTTNDPALHQHVVEIDFKVDTLRASLYKSTQDGTEKPLGDVAFQGFGLEYAMDKFVMKVAVNLRSLSMHVNQVGKEPLQFMSSAAGPSKEDLLIVKYTRVQQASPEYHQVYEGIDQNVDVKISTFLFRAAPEPVVTLYDFIMTTFVPQNSGKAAAAPAPGIPEAENGTPQMVVNAGGSPEKIRVLLTLASIQVILINDDVQIATLSLSTAYVAILLRANTMRINGRLGSLALNDDSAIETASSDFKKILSIEGDNFADFTYQTYDPADYETYTGVKSSISLQTGSLKVYYLEHALHDAYQFLIKLAKLKGLYDAATEVAVQRASGIERMKFDVSISTPIVVFPSDSQHSLDVLTLRLGAFSAHNAYEDDDNRIIAGLHGIQLASRLYIGEEPAELKMVDDIDINAEVTQKGDIDRSKDVDYPATQVAVKISDVRLHLTQTQYCLVIALLQSIPKVFADVPDTDLQSPKLLSAVPSIHNDGAKSAINEVTSTVDLRPELSGHPGEARPWTTIDLVVTISAVRLHLYDAQATTSANVKEHGIARFALIDDSLRLKMLSDGALEAQFILKSMTMNNTRPGSSRFREIMPAAQHERNQVMLLFTMSGGQNSQSLAVLSVDSPEIIFAVDPVFALLDFFTSAFFAQAQDNDDEEVAEAAVAQQSQTSNSGGSFDFRFDLHDVSVSILEDDTSPDTQAIRLSVKQLLVSQQGVFAVSVNNVGMSLTRMGKPTESVRFLDDLDLTFTLDSRTSESHQSTSIEVSALPIVFRASYRDIMLIMTIVNKAIELYGKSTQPSEQDKLVSEKALSRPMLQSRKVSRPTTSRPQPIGSARVAMSKEQFRGSIEGFRLVLIGDLHEQPLLHLRVKPFILGAKDWSGELQATSTLSLHISYWNLTNSHWEPLIDPWTLTASIGKESAGGLKMSINSNQRLDVNVTMSFVELALATMSMLGAEGERMLQKARGSYAPYRIWNRTGYPLFIWSDTEGQGNIRETNSKQIANGKTIDWRFDDWRTMREHVSSSGRNSIGVQIVGKQWEHLRSVPVDREGEYTFSLRPRTEKYAHRLVCEVKVQGNIKLVVLRSTYKIENLTLYPLELTLVDETGQPVYAVEKIVPGQDYALPLDAVNQCRVRVQPDQGFGYKWSPAVRWEDLIAKRGFTLRCPHNDQTEAAFRFQAWAEADANDVASRKLPRISLKLRAPVELENLLPYNLEYRIYDKDTDQNWRSYLRQGGVMPVHSVELGHMILLNIHVQDTVFKPSDFAIINTDGNSDFDVETNVVLRDANGRKLDLRLNYVHYPDAGGSFKVQIYTPYIVINKTGLPFAVRPAKARVGTPAEAAGETRPDILAKHTPFMLSHPNDNKDFAFRIGESSWSQGVSFDAPTAETRLVVQHQTQRSEEIHVGLSWTEGLGKYKLTKVVTLAPRFLIKNNSSQPLAFREHGVAPRGRSSIEPAERVPLHFLRVGDEKLLTIAVPGLNAQWSAPINFEDIGVVHFRLPTSENGQQIRLMRADVKIDGPTIHVFLAEAIEGWPFKIENDSDYSFRFSQTDQNRVNAGPNAKPTPAYSITQKSSVDYAWDAPAARDKRIVLQFGSSHREVDIMEIGDLVPFKFASERGTRVVSLDVRADGPKQVLRISNYDAEYSLYKPKRRNTNNSLTRSDSLNSSQDGFEAVQETVSPVLTVVLDLHGIGVSLVNKRMLEVVYLSLNTLKFEYANNPVAQSVTASCGSLQIDNQLHDALFPVVLQPTPISQDSKTVAALPTVQASIIWLNDEEHGVFFVKYCSILLQALTVEADEDFLFSVYDLTKIKGASWDVAQEDILIQSPEDIPEPQAVARGQDLYFEVLELQPIKLSISFMRTERVSGEDKLSLRNPFAVVLNAITMAVGNVNDAPLEMNALAIKDMRLTLPDIQERITHHYRQEVLRQLYRILGSADFIGNPVGLFTNVSSGVADFFYEPFNGVIVHGNKDIGIGIAKGAASFVKKTVFGFSDSFTKFTSSVGKGLSATTFDSDYQLRRRMNQRRNRPRHAIYGVAAGAEAFASSVVSGVEGVVMKPIEGAESEGAKGFFKGVGKGLIGAVTKPVIGVFDLAANVGEGIRNTTTVFDNPARDRVRLPRLIPADGVLVPFSEREALGQYWMKDLDHGAFRDETYVAHLNLPGGDNVVLLTTTKVLSFWSNRLRLEWELPFTQVQGVTIEDTGIKFAHKAGKQHDKFIHIPDKSSQGWFFQQVASVVKAFNARRRMDS